FLLTGSVVLPLKAVLTNLFSISASFGALVFVFQQGHLSGLLGFTAQSIDPSIPVILFSLVFGMSMDYEVLLISRIQEEYQRTGDNQAGVAMGLEKSGRRGRLGARPLRSEKGRRWHPVSFRMRTSSESLLKPGLEFAVKAASGEKREGARPRRSLRPRWSA